MLSTKIIVSTICIVLLSSVVTAEAEGLVARPLRGTNANRVLNPTGSPLGSEFTSKSRNAIVQMFMRPWNEVKNECTNGRMDSFGAIQVSPPQEHPLISNKYLDGKYTWWLHYQSVNFKKLDSALGTRVEFEEMAAACSERGVGIIVDVVINHMTRSSTSGTGSAGTTWNGQAYEYFSSNDFHSPCDITDDNNATQMQNCQLHGLNDLKTEDITYVQGQIAEFLNDLIGIPGVIGFRVDAAKHIPADDLKAIFKQVKGDPFVLLETLGIQLKSHFGNYEPLGIGTDSFCRDSLDWAIGPQNGNPWEFLNGIESNWCYGSGNPQSGNARKALWYISNHDDERSNDKLSYYNDNWLGSSTRTTMYDAALAWILMYPHGVPRLTSGFGNLEGDWPIIIDRDDAPPNAINGFNKNNVEMTWDNMHQSTSIQNLLKIHNTVIYPDDIWVTHKGRGNNDEQVCWSLTILSSGLGDAFVAINAGRNVNNGNWSATQATSLPDGHYCNSYLEGATVGDSCEMVTYTVSNGMLDFDLSQTGDRILILSRAFGVATNVAFVTFEIVKKMKPGERIFITGNWIGWRTCDAVPLNTFDYPVGRTTVKLPVGHYFEWKPIISGTDCKNPTWMNGSNLQFSTGAANSETNIPFDWS